MAEPTIEPVSTIRLGWGESACWRPDTATLHFVDCLAQEVGGFDDRAGREIGRLTTPSLPTALYPRADGDQLLVQLDDGLHAFSPGSPALTLVVETPSGALRFNDGIVAPDGAIVTGSLIFGAGAAPTAGSYWRYSARMGWRKLLEGKGNTNGPCFSPDGAYFYVADSTAGLIYRFAYDPQGDLSEETVFADVGHLGGGPDGAAVDADGCLWTTIFGGSCIAQYAPGGRLERVVALPASHPTSLAFGGAGMDILYVTTIGAANVGLALSGPMSGAVLRLEGLGARGVRRTPCQV